MSGDAWLAAPAGAPPIDAVLEAFDHAVAVIRPNGEPSHANRAWYRVLGTAPALYENAGAHPGTALLAIPPAPDMLKACVADQSVRHFDLHDQARGRRYRVRIAPAGSGRLLVELLGVHDETTSPQWHGVASERGSHRRSPATHHEIVGSGEPAAILDVLTRAALARCHAAGAAVITMADDTVDVIAAAGVLAGVRGRHVSIAPDEARRALHDHHAVSGDVLTLRARLFARTELESDIGPMLTAPLQTHEGAFGALAIVRRRGALPFSDRESHRLELLADQAALALWKAELLARAQDADLAKSRFIATVSHELRTPLTALTGYEELLSDEVLGPLTEAQSDVVERMRTVTHHLAGMIEELLAFSSLETGREKVRPTDFLAADLVRAAAAVIAPQASNRNLTLDLDIAGDPIRMHTDADKIRQVLLNLAGNAVKFTETGGVALGVSRAADGRVQFTVRDTGIGISEDDVGRLFRPFAQLDAGLTRRHGGTGLGLYISQRLVTMIGGEIGVSSALGKGSVFTVLVPETL